VDREGSRRRGGRYIPRSAEPGRTEGDSGCRHRTRSSIDVVGSGAAAGVLRSPLSDVLISRMSREVTEGPRAKCSDLPTLPAKRRSAHVGSS
jgi:hypothetical protein